MIAGPDNTLVTGLGPSFHMTNEMHDNCQSLLKGVLVCTCLQTNLIIEQFNHRSTSVRDPSCTQLRAPARNCTLVKGGGGKLFLEPLSILS